MASWKKVLVIFLVYYALLYIGAAIIMYIEANELEPTPSAGNITQPLAHLIEEELNVTANSTVIKRVIELSREITEKSKREKDLEWRREISWSVLYKWRYFVHITLTTLGYGDIVPMTDGGKIFVIIYGTIGIPVNIIFITTIGTVLSRLFQSVIKTTEKRIFKIRNIKHVEIKTSILLSVFCVLWLAMGAGINTSVMNWSWTEGFYAAFVRLSTIGYGDYKIEFKRVQSFGELIAWYTNVGLALAAGVFDAFSTWMQPKSIASQTSQKKKQSQIDKERRKMGNQNEAVELDDIFVKTQNEKMAA